MVFEIGFNNLSFNDDNFLVKELGAYWVSTGSDKYPPYEQLEIEVKDFKELERLLEKVNKGRNISEHYAAVISFDPPGIFLDNKI
jgi:hypothetical protein